MARLDSFAKHNRTPRRIGAPFFNLDSNVGPTLFAAYRRTDVQLVQVLLLIIDDDPSPAFNPFRSVSAPPPPEKPADKLTADGTFGPITRAWVKWFQLMDGLDADAKIALASNGRSTSLAGRPLAIIRLNEVISGNSRHTNLRFDPATPPELKKELSRGL